MLWVDTNTGKLLDVDVELNAGAGAFADCEAMTCTSSLHASASNAEGAHAGLVALGALAACGSWRRFRRRPVWMNQPADTVVGLAKASGAGSYHNQARNPMSRCRVRD